MNDQQLASMIDHTLLKQDALRDDVVRVCAEAREHGFAAVCVHPYWIELVAEQLKDSSVAAGTTVGFPQGLVTTPVKAFEAGDALRRGAEELDMVINMVALKNGDHDYVREDIRAVVSSAEGRVVKVILETGLLTDGEKADACRLCVEAGADFVKTSTGLAGGPATVEDIRLMRGIVGPDFGVKASGGIRTREDAVRMIEAGANRLGTSSGVSIMGGAPRAGSE